MDTNASQTPSQAAGPGDLIPVTVLTGFLGAGKSTLLNHLLNRPELSDAAVLINEFGEVGIDHLLVRRVDEDIVLLNSGCLCCTVRGDMITALRDLFLKRVRGEVPEFRRLVIETTGLADPAPILHTLMSDPLISARYRMDGVVTLVDAVTGSARLDDSPEAAKQAAVADRLVLSKTDLAEEDAVNALKQRLKGVNPAAPQIIGDHGQVDPADLLNCGLFHPETKQADVAGWLREEAYAEANHGHHHDHDHHHHGHGENHHGHDHHDHDHGNHDHHHDINRHDARISAFTLTFQYPITWESFLFAIEMLIASKGEDLLRIKGILNVVDQDTPIAIHGVQHVFHPPATLPAWPEGHDRQSRIVFITRDLGKDTVEKVFRATLEE